MKLVSSQYFAVPALIFICASLSQILPLATANDNTTKPVSFVRSVAPIFMAKCQACHGAKRAESNYRIDTFNALMQPGDFATPPVTVGDLESSEILRLITAEDPEERMPNNGSRLTDREIQTISTWITQGAKFDGKDPAAPLRLQLPTDIPHPAAPQSYPNALPVTAMAFTEDGDQLIVGGYHELLVWHSKSGALMSRVGNIPQRSFGAAFSRDYSWLAVAGGSPGVSGEVRLVPWSEAAKQQPHQVLATHDDVFFAIAYRPDGSQLVAGGADGFVRVYDLPGGAEKLKISSHADWVTAVAFSPDGNLIATASRDKTAKVFDANTGSLLATFSEHGVPVRAIAFTPDGNSVISAGGNRVCVWNAGDAKLIGDMTGFGGELHAVLSGGESIIASSSDRTVRQFKLADRSPLRTFGEHPAAVVSLAWHASSKLLCTGCYDGTVTLFNLETGEKVRQFLSVPAAPPSGGESHPAANQ